MKGKGFGCMSLWLYICAVTITPKLSVLTAGRKNKSQKQQQSKTQVSTRQGKKPFQKVGSDLFLYTIKPISHISAATRNLIQICFGIFTHSKC